MKKLNSDTIISCNYCGAINIFNEDKDIIVEKTLEYDLKNYKNFQYIQKIGYCSHCHNKIVISCSSFVSNKIN